MSARLHTNPARSVRTSAQSVAAHPNLARKRAMRQIMIGLAMLVIGLVVTVATYSHASSSSTGGTYIVAWGPIVFGALGAVRGFLLLARSRGQR